jgi:hypothetical protein
MIDGLRSRNREVLRQALTDVNTSKIEQTNAALDDAVAFATGIKRQQTVDGDADSGYETYRKGAIGEQIDQGLIETVTAGVGNKIASALANLFTAKNQHWSYLVDENKSEEAEELIMAHRKEGGFSTAIVSADFLACAINGSFVYIDARGDHLKYHVVSPTCLYAIYGDTIVDSGVERAVDYSEIEDATAIVLQLNDKSDPVKQQYLAIFGRNEQYPFGRHVTYYAANWYSIPDVGDDDAHDYTLPGGQVANPLSYHAALHVDEEIPEYPFISLDGGLTKVTKAIVTPTTSLYENCIEFDIAYSRILKDGLNAARGKNVLTNELNRPLPRSLEGDVALQDGQTLQVMGQPASNAQGAVGVLQSAVVSVANGYTVPGYMVVAGSDALPYNSGVALLIRMTPLIDFRSYRVALNAPQINRLWHIEKNLLRVYWGDQYEWLKEVEQQWDAGTLVVPEDNLAKTERLKLAQDSGYIDYVEAVKKYHNLATDEEAMLLIEKYDARAEDFPPPDGDTEPDDEQSEQLNLTGEE